MEKLVKIIRMDECDARYDRREALIGKTLKYLGNHYYKFTNMEDCKEYCKASGYNEDVAETIFDFEMAFVGDENCHEEIPERTIVKYGDVIHLKNIGVYHFIGDARDGSFLGIAEEITTDLDDIRLGLRPRDLERYAKFAVDKGIKFGKDW